MNKIQYAGWTFTSTEMGYSRNLIESPSIPFVFYEFSPDQPIDGELLLKIANHFYKAGLNEKAREIRTVIGAEPSGR